MTADDIDWTAFRYVHGELNADEALAFELALESDQAAREAVARAVELSEAIRAAAGTEVLPIELADTEAAPVSLAESNRRAWSATGWAVAAVAASIALAVWLDPNRMAPAPLPGVGPAAEATPADTDDAAESSRLLAQAWVEVNAEFAAEQPAADDPSEAIEADAFGTSALADSQVEYRDPMGLEPVYRADDGSELPAPDWLVSAVVETSAAGTAVTPSATEVP